MLPRLAASAGLTACVLPADGERRKGGMHAASSGGAAGTHFTCTAINTGNTAAGGGDKAVWLLTGHFVAVAENGTGAAFLATS